MRDNSSQVQVDQVTPDQEAPTMPGGGHPRRTPQFGRDDIGQDERAGDSSDRGNRRSPASRKNGQYLGEKIDTMVDSLSDPDEMEDDDDAGGYVEPLTGRWVVNPRNTLMIGLLVTCCAVSIHAQERPTNGEQRNAVTQEDSSMEPRQETEPQQSMEDTKTMEDMQPMEEMPANQASSRMAEPAGTKPVDSAGFYANALASGKAEVALSEHAMSHATSPDVKALAKMMVDHHTALNDKLMAASGMPDAPTQPPADAAAADEVKATPSAAYDQAWLAHMANGHAKSIALYEATGTSSDDAEARALATAALPTLQEHARRIDTVRMQAGTAQTP